MSANTVFPRAQLSRLKEASKAFDIDEASKRIGSMILAKAELEALKSEEEVLSTQLREYEALKSGAVTVLKAENLDELPSILIRARIVQRLSQRQLADKLGLTEQQIQRYESEGYASASLRRISKIANVLELNVSELAEIKQKLPIDRQDDLQNINWSLFPVKEMYRRNWFVGFSGSIKEAVAEAESLVKNFVKGVKRQPTLAMHRKHVRSGSAMDPYALLAWECRILTLAEKLPPKGEYIRASLDNEWLRKLVQMSRFRDGPVRAKNYLDRAGISLVIESHLHHTHLDGAAFLRSGKPLIGLTLRYDRLDNFWFVLLHELMHVIKHLRKRRMEYIFDDMEATPDEMEREVDKLALQALIHDQDWEIA